MQRPCRQPGGLETGGTNVFQPRSQGVNKCYIRYYDFRKNRILIFDEEFNTEPISVSDQNSNMRHIICRS